MFDIIARQLICGAPSTSHVHTSDQDQSYYNARPHGNSRRIKIRNVLTGLVTEHPSVYDALERYPKAYPKILTALIKDPSKTWRNLQVKDAADDTPWEVPEDSLPNNDKGGGRFALICMVHKQTNELKLVTRQDAAKVLGVTMPTITSMAVGITPGRASYEWWIRYATVQDLVACPSFIFDHSKMILRRPKN